ncbi:MAG: hypothetical protein IJJ20_05780 [Thermoguttaceae bacterium]|nr:hypothetical protein [Thermoguttaceae bacterium]
MAFYFSNSPGEKIGPVTREELVRLAEEGNVAGTTRVLTYWRNRSARTLSFLKPAFERGKDGTSEDELTWRNTLSVSEDAGGAAPGTFPYGYAGDVYFVPFWRRSRRLRRTLKITFWLLLILLILAVGLFAGSFAFLAGKTTLLGIFGNVFFGLAAFFVIFPLLFSLILCRVGIASTYVHEAQVRAAEDLRKLRMLNESKSKGK